MNIESRKKRTCANNRGMALVSVLIIVTLIGILGSSILRLSYLAYARKLVEKRNTENFYAAEAVIDTVKATLQNEASSVFSEVDNSDDFAAAVFKKITGQSGTKIENNEANASIIDGIEATLLTQIAKMGKDNTETAYSDAISSNGGDFQINGDIEIVDDAVYIRDVYVKYVNNEGYISEITTDIVINSPVYASDETLPVGTYSMFAGNGSTIYSQSGADWDTNNGGERQMHQVIYYHQEGNVYMGSMSDGTANGSTTSLIVGTSDGDTTASQTGMTFMSIGGTNVVINGDLIVANGNSLFFTGGDGTETANIQINGYIVLQNGATLFIAPNCNIVCKGIVTDITYNADGSVASYTTYSGANQEATVSQFYPYKESYISSSSVSGYSDKFNTGTIDVETVLNTLSPNSVNSSNMDTRYVNVATQFTSSATSSTVDAAIYILDVDTGTDGTWTTRCNDVYYLVKCTTSGSVGNTTWTFSSSCSKYAGNIVCNESDTNLTQEKKVKYTDYEGNVNYYDAEFAEIVNIPLFSLLMTGTIGKASKYVADYPDKTSYSSIHFDDLLSVMTDDSWWLNNYINWTDVDAFDFGTRSFDLLPSGTTISDLSINTTVTDTKGNTYTLSNSNSQVELGITEDNISPSGGKVYFWVSNYDVNVHLETGASTGALSCLFMSAKKVNFSPARSYVRGVSLVELAESLGDSYGGLEDEDNPVRQYLELIGSSVVYTDLSIGVINSISSSSKNTGEGYSYVLFNNMFNGGISVFWERGASTTTDSDSSSSSSSSSTSTSSFVDTENWSRD